MKSENDERAFAVQIMMFPAKVKLLQMRADRLREAAADLDDLAQMMLRDLVPILDHIGLNAKEVFETHTVKVSEELHRDLASPSSE